MLFDHQAQEAATGVRPERAQARGRALLNLKLRDAEGGLLGRTLLTFILNKVQPSYILTVSLYVCVYVYISTVPLYMSVYVCLYQKAINIGYKLILSKT